MSECKEQVCCETSPFDGQCCQPTPFDYKTPEYKNTEQCYTATCPEGQVGSPVTKCVPEGSYTSTISQADANAQALTAATAAANAALVCTCGGLSVPTISPTGEVVLPVTVTLSHANPLAEIYYSINSSAGPFVLYTGPFIITELVDGQPAVTAYARVTGCDSETTSSTYTVDTSCKAYSFSQLVTLNTVCDGGYVAECGGYANWSITFESGPYNHQNLLGAFNLYDYFPYLQMWDGICPLGCRGTPRIYAGGSLIIGPYDVDTEIFAITQLFVDDVFSFDDDAVPGCSCDLTKVCPSSVLKTLPAGQTTELKVWDTFGAHSWACGIIGVREAGTESECGIIPPGSDVCGCDSDNTIERLMRAVQERYRVGQRLAYNSGGGSFITWPDRVLPSPASPGHYPVDGFYDADTNSDRIDHVKAIRNAFDDGWVRNYLTGSLEGLNNSALPRYTVAGLGVPDEDEITSVLSGIGLLQPCACRLTTILSSDDGPFTPYPYPNIFSPMTLKSTGTTETPFVSCPEAQEALQAAWSTAPTFPDFIVPSLAIVVGLTTQAINAEYGALTRDLTNYGQGTATAYAVMRVPSEGQVVNYLAFAPHSMLDGLYHSFQTTASGGVYTSAVYGYPGDTIAFEAEPPHGCGSGEWDMDAFVMTVTKSNVPSVGDWHYYP